ncbi:putative phage abortive infection protein [Parapedobacter koreensis]|uniref:Putative phage abortive infection protein n=1 Tax=Parapedobacter koreensis TaxID=332977 RepID=A0A1H7NJL6_9SPHI|nr:putative phage abortive infection protein [Parapedobacter koreensis]SEL23676.1 Putative phage abortive infection protein [Parapedobacter koreensis]
MNISLIVFISVLLVVAVILSIGVLIDNRTGRAPKEKGTRKYSSFDTQVLLLLSTAVVLLIFAFLSPLIFSETWGWQPIDYDSSGVIGDTIGGLMNPFIAIAAVIVTGLAFYMQYQANQQIREQFKIQQFESQFYEMLRLHKQNVDEIELIVYDEGVKKTEKPSTARTGGPEIDSPYVRSFIDPRIVKGRKVFIYYVQEFHVLLDCVGKSELQRINKESFSEAYHVFFGGLDKFPHQNDLFSETLRNSVEKEVRMIKEDDLKNHKYLHTYFDLFRGHIEYLGHYYRHLYMTVKYVVESFEKNDVLKSRKECLKYLKILRAQLSNAEQIMLFYNWVAGGGSGYGAKWEKGDKRKYFSKYLMLHNLHFGMLFGGPNHFIKQEVNEIYRRAENKDKLFELDVDGYLEGFEEQNA